MPWRVPEEELQRIKEQTDLVALVQSRGIELKKHGIKDWIGHCPFHQDQETANFIVTPVKGLWHCMACGKAGNAIQFVQQHDGVSFRHALEILRTGGSAAFKGERLKTATVPKLECPLDAEADDQTLVRQVLAYYQERLKVNRSGAEYLASRGLDNQDLFREMRIGFADRTLGLRLPDKNRKEGESLRTRLTQLGLWRESGHEHFNGCIVVPFFDEAGNVVSFYGRRVTHGSIKHLYQSGPHRGIFNRAGLAGASEIILCEAVIDAMTFWVNGFKNVTALFGTEGFTDELWEAIKHARTIRIAYDADDAGERAAQRDAERFKKHGIEVFRIRFPHGMDANEYAGKVTPADKSLALLVNSAGWLGQGKSLPNAAWPPASSEPLKHVAMVVDELTGQPLPIVDKESLEMGVGWAPLPFVPAPFGEVQAQRTPASSLAAPVSGLSACVPNGGITADRQDESAKEKMAKPPPPPLENPVIVPVAAPVPTPRLEQRGEQHFLSFDNREYRVAGLEKTLGTESLKLALRLQCQDRYHLDQLDLSRDQERRRFIERAAEETGLTSDLLKRDLGRLLLAVEQAQIELMKPKEKAAAVVQLSPEEREEALAWLKAPDLINRLREAFTKSGLIGEEANTLVSYLACVSRKLERPLAVIIQSASAAGKTTLMEAVLNFFPEEERIKYSAMTGQSLYYLGETNLKHKILAVVEEAGAEKASYALKLLQSEGELTIASTGKDPQSGKMVTHEYRVEGPVMIFLTTTAIDLDEELQNRCLTLAVDESSEQTERIHQFQRERRTLAGLIAREERKELLKKLRNAQRLLAPVLMHNPYAPDLTFAHERTRHRRDNEKYLTLIDSITLLHQHQRERERHEINGRVQEVLQTTLDDIALANQLAPEVLGRSLDELPPQTRRLFSHIRELMRAKKKSGAGTPTFTRKELRDLCGWSLTQLRVHLERLVDLEYLVLRNGRLGSQFLYEILFDLNAPDSVAHIGLIEVDKLRHAYESKVTGFDTGVTGQNGQVTGGDQMPPPPININGERALPIT